MKNVTDYNKSLNEGTSEFSIDSEYEGKIEKLSYKKNIDSGLKDLLDDMLELSIDEKDFIEKMTYGLTDRTSKLNVKDINKLKDWYKSNSESEKPEKKTKEEIAIEKLKVAYQKLYSKYPLGARRLGFKHRSSLGYDEYGDLYFHSDWPREFRHEDEYGEMGEKKEKILAAVEDWEYEVSKLFTKYKVKEVTHA
tara:strand:- start:1516 stop:2097 length:582 start_codon:yes stop_codon:yes gene_type:complete